MKTIRTSLMLLVILLVGAILRFWYLDVKPLWMDEVITALFSLGRNYYDVPLDQVVPVSVLEQVFTLNPQTTCAQIVETVSVQSVHPPLFFCWMHGWISGMAALPLSWIWKLRAFPALVGIVAIAAIYQLNRVAFSRSAGLAAAAIMATSPFAVYLSQEARHYTLPMLLVILALLGLHQLLTDLQGPRIRPTLWLGWIAVNSLGFYIHYFFLLAFIPQALILALQLGLQRGLHLGPLSQSKIQNRSTEVSTERLDRTAHERPKSKIVRLSGSAEAHRSAHAEVQNSRPLPILLAIAVVCLTYLPWLPTFLSHMGRPETDWMQSPTKSWLHAIAPLYQIPLGWVVMVITLPVEQQPLWIAIPAATTMLIFSGWLVSLVVQGVKTLWRSPATHQATWMLLMFLAVVILEFLAIAYVLGKDITLIPRYNFIYFPAICALLAASLDALKVHIKAHQAIWIVLLVGLISSFCVTSNLVFQKSYNPDLVAKDMSIDPNTPRLVTMAYSDFQDIALGLSFALRLHQSSNQSSNSQSAPQSNSQSHTQFAFMAQFQGYEPVWQKLAALEHPLSFPLNLWAISPGLKRGGYHAQLTLRDRAGTAHACLIDPYHFHRIGIPYQLYRCR